MAKILDRTWFYTKLYLLMYILDVVLMVGVLSILINQQYAKVNTELDKFYVDKIKEMDLQEPEFRLQ